MYQALYRKYRPDTFDGIVGQEPIVKTLKNEMLTGKVSHAYLFCGTRGTGKTSTAKIFAKAINCLTPQNGEPCGKCDMCTAMQEGRSVNVIEIDAASNNGVENIRDIREEVKYPPTEGRYKVYIIDEVHMLSQGAFNALLKTLEEPPEHVIFILATTDPQKVPVTILSRCQRFDFKRIPSGQIAAALRKYMTIEGADIDNDALMEVARIADGSMRDSLSILDQCLAFYSGESITAEKVLRVSGAADKTVFFEMTDAITAKNADKCMEIVDDIFSDGREIRQFVSDFMEHLRNLLVTLTAENPEELIDLSQDGINKLKAQAKNISSDEVIYLIKVFSALLSDMRYASNQRIMLETELIKLSAPTARSDVDYLSARLAEIERKLKNGMFQPVQKEADGEKKKTAKKALPKAVPENIKQVIGEWKSTTRSFDEPAIKNLLETSSAVYEDDGKITIVCDDGAAEDILTNKTKTIKNVLEQKYKRMFEIKIMNRSKCEDMERLKDTQAYEAEEEALTDGVKITFPDADIK